MDNQQLLKGWEIVRELGSGGFGKVYEIKPEGGADSSQYHSALKVVNIPPSREFYSHYEDDGYTNEEINSLVKSQVDAVKKECEIMAGLKGLTNIVSYEEHSIAQLDGGKAWQILIRMELLTPLVQYLQTNGISEQTVIELGKDICTALERCLRRTIIHRDIKPQNLFINQDGDFKLGDFGIAKAMEHMTVGTRTGTYSYMAPEVFLNRPYDHRVDIYSLGLVLYWMLNERRMPFLPLAPAVPTVQDHENAPNARLSGAALPPPKNGSPALKDVVLKACAFNPEDRYATPEQFRSALEYAAAAPADATMPPDYAASAGYAPDVPFQPYEYTGEYAPDAYYDSSYDSSGYADSYTPNSAYDQYGYAGGYAPPQDQTADSACPWCRGRGNQVYVLERKAHKYIAYRDRCKLCAGTGNLEIGTIPFANDLMDEIIHSQERWKANIRCACCKGRGWVYVNHTSKKNPSVQEQTSQSLFGSITPCPQCAGDRVTHVLTSKQKKLFNKKLRLSLLLASMLISALLALIMYLFTPARVGTASLFSYTRFLIPLTFIYPAYFYFKHRNLRIVERKPLKVTVFLSLLISMFLISVVVIPLFLPSNDNRSAESAVYAVSADDLEGEEREAFLQMLDELNSIMK